MILAVMVDVRVVVEGLAHMAALTHVVAVALAHVKVLAQDHVV